MSTLVDLLGPQGGLAAQDERFVVGSAARLGAVQTPRRIVVDRLPPLVGRAPVVAGAHPPPVPTVQVPGVVVAASKNFSFYLWSNWKQWRAFLVQKKKCKNYSLDCSFSVMLSFREGFWCGLAKRRPF